jgi:hypothetical protein
MDLGHSLSLREVEPFFTIVNNKFGLQVEQCAQRIDDKGATFFVSWSAEWPERDVYQRLLGILKNCPPAFEARKHALNSIIDDSIGKPPPNECVEIGKQLEHLPNILGDLETLRDSAAKRVAYRCGQSP